MEKTNDEKRDKFLLLFVPTVTHQSDVFICCSIGTGNLFISIIFLILSGLYFYNSLYTKDFNSILQLIYTLVYGACGCFLLNATFTQNYIYAKIFAIFMGGCIELGIMSYFIYVMYCFLIISKYYNNDINRVGAEYQELLKEFKEDKEFKELKN